MLRILLFESANSEVSLFHVSGWSSLSDLSPGVSFVLKPGTQNAEGIGVYFSEGEPRPTAAEGSRDSQKHYIKIVVDNSRGWWRTSPGNVKKFNRPRTWHTDGKSIELKFLGKDEKGYLVCNWRFHA